MGFVKGAWKVLVAIKDGLVLLAMLLFFGLILAALSWRPNPAAVTDGALLVKLDGVIVEEPENIDPFATVLGGQAPLKQYRERDLIRAIDTAATDDRIKVIVLDLASFMGGGQVSLEQVGEAIGRAKAKGKPVLSFATFYSDAAYMLASHGSEIWVDPMGGAAFTGPGGTRLYYKDALDRFKVTAHVYRVGTFKSAVEPYLRSDQSPEAEEALLAVYRPIWENWQAVVKKARPQADIAGLINDPAGAVTAASGDLVKIATDRKIIDKVGDRTMFGKRVAKLAGADEDEGPGAFKHTSLKDWVAANPAKTGGDEVQVVTIAGTIVDGEAGPGTAGGDRIEKLLHDGLKRDNVKALVVRVDSPGGSAFASEQIRRAIEEYRARKIPVIVSMGNVAASGGYWVSTAGDAIFAEPSTITGSIGIFAVLPSFERALAEYGVKADGVATTPLSGQPDVFGGFNSTVDTFIQGTIEHDYRRFLALVGKARGMSVDQVDNIAQGRVWDGGTARQIKLVDRFGSIEDAIAEAAKRAKLGKDSYSVKYLETEPDPFEQFVSGMFAPAEEEKQATGLVARLAWQQRAALGQVLGDLKVLGGTDGVQAWCLECSGALPPRHIAKADAGWLATLFRR
ncbi:MAG: signal peptide peptidase SppA [Sphingomonadales bacterium RIFCSPHIGHO2_01_FULL_65_20]|uniref:signal peptide peptidase SppA n=1 Tax=unclassified Blastomonas TaxID=2626550 RepID=UPI000829A335|nr:signal peptide peptidase SppA [Blastomonas sp.]MCH2236936.1 signal peptide peptidase SppA [Blastomonas sp.]OHC91850.1 MAG: signal peptide peptidase SppA [Sphingomonadales bacterium RIFCSPHIGHO2_01_FULL_65_20]